MENGSSQFNRICGGRISPLKALIVFFTIAVLFVLFQVNVLNKLQQSQKVVDEEPILSHKREKRANSASFRVDGPEIARNINPKFAPAFQGEIGIKVNGLILRGVMKAHRKFYVPNKDGSFMCLNGNQTVPWTAVNNDNCDCQDGSDEPGTSACKNGRFYCEPELQFISSTHVNDGLCNCCDGSDEWKGVTLPPDHPVDDEERRAPCSDVCLDYEHLKVREMNLMKQGAAVKQSYIEEGISHIGDGKYGPQGEFYKLSLRCYTLKTPKYTYEVCPYVNSTQNGKDVWLIGTGGRLEGNQEDGYQLVMEDGKGDHCPGGKKRKTTITFRCGIADRIKHMSEKDVCMYAAKFETPAACPNLDQLR